MGISSPPAHGDNLLRPGFRGGIPQCRRENVEILEGSQSEIAQHVCRRAAGPFGSAFHDLPLADVSKASFKQDAIGNTDFPDIVQWREQKYLLDVFVIEAVFWRELFSYDSGIARHPVRCERQSPYRAS